MKLIITTILTTFILAGCGISDQLPCDFDGDGEATKVDLAALQAATQEVTEWDRLIDIYDVDDDGEVTIADLIECRAVVYNN